MVVAAKKDDQQDIEVHERGIDAGCQAKPKWKRKDER